MADWDVVRIDPLRAGEAMPPAMVDEQAQRDAPAPAPAPAREAPAPTGIAGVARPGDGVPLAGGPEGKGRVGGRIRAGSESRVGPDEVPGWVDKLSDRVFTAEGTKGNPWQFYGGDTFKPGKDHPREAAARPGYKGETHAAGPGQWQPGTWDETKPAFADRFGRDPDFSSMVDQKWMIALRAGTRYPGGLDQLQKDAEAGKIDASKLSDWDGFKKGGGSGWSVTSAGQWRVKDEAIAFEQGRSNSRVVWMAPDDYLSMFPATSSGEKRKSLMRSLGLGEPIEEIPSLEVKADGPRLKVIDQDGANRARAAKEQGVEAIPVAVHGAGAQTWLEDMNGKVRRFNFDGVAPVKSKIDEYTGREQKPGQSVDPIRALGRFYDQVGGAAVEGARRGYGEGPVSSPLDMAGRDVNAVIGAGAGLGSEIVRQLSPVQNLPALSPGGAPLNIPDALEALPETMAGLVGVGGVPAAQGARVPGGLGAVPRAIEAAPAGNNMASELRATNKLVNRAVELLNRRIAEDEKAAPGSTGKAVEQYQAAQGAGEPAAIVDYLGENARGLVGNVSREPGPGRQTLEQWAKGRMGDVDRPSPIAESIRRGIDRLLGTQSAKSEAQHLADARSVRARGVWKKAEDAVRGLPKVQYETARDYTAAQKDLEAASKAVETAEAKLDQMTADASKQHLPVPIEPERLTTFLIGKGGLADDTFSSRVNTERGRFDARTHATDVRRILDGAKGFRGLLKPRVGISLDMAAEAAFEAGYIAEYDNNLLLDALAQDVAGSRVYARWDEDYLAAHREAVAHNAAIDEELAKRPVGERPKVTEPQLQEGRDKLAAAKAERRAAQERFDELKEFVEAGQADGTLLLPGAVTSPVIRRLVKNPRIRQGLAKGARIERDLADAELRRIDQHDYAVVGTDEAGDPIIGAVPTMKLLMKGKEGLDAMLESEQYRDQLTRKLNAEGRGIAKLRDTFLKELDRINPDYKAARDQWAGDSALIHAVADGQKMPLWKVEEIEERMKGASDSEKKFLRIGFADTLRTDLDEKVFAADPSKAIVNSTADRQRIETVAGSPQAADQFIQKIKRARQQFASPVNLVRGSDTARRLAEDSRGRGLDRAAAAFDVAASVAAHNPIGLVRKGLQYGQRHAPQAVLRPFGLDLETKQTVDAAIARIATDGNLRINVQPGRELIERFPLPNVQGVLNRGARAAAASNLGNAMLQTLRGAGGGGYGIPPRGAGRPPPF